MPLLEFGTGVLYGEPNSGNLPANPTPIRLLLQEVSVEFKGDLKKLWTQSQFPIAKARGKVDVTGKAKICSFEPQPINQLFFAQTQAAGMLVPIDRELNTISGTTVTVTNAANFDKDNGVQYTTGPTPGQILLKVASAPTLGQYAVNSTSGVYTFNASDNAVQVAISYTYTNSTRGSTITLNNQLMGFAPEFRADIFNTFRSKVWGLRLNSCVMGQWTFPSKLEDFWVSDCTFDASTDSADVLGKLFADNF